MPIPKFALGTGDIICTTASGIPLEEELLELLLFELLLELLFELLLVLPELPPLLLELLKPPEPELEPVPSESEEDNEQPYTKARVREIIRRFAPELRNPFLLAENCPIIVFAPYCYGELPDGRSTFYSLYVDIIINLAKGTALIGLFDILNAPF